MKLSKIFSLFFLIIAMPLVLAHSEATSMWKTTQMYFIYATIAISGIFITFSVVLRANVKKFEKYSKVLFYIIIIPVVFTSLFLIANTVYENVNSVTKGPVHWHADFEIWNCGQKINPIDPEGLSNKVGSPVLHEHGDLRIHVEGIVKDYEDINLREFFHELGGDLTENSLSVPTNDGLLNVRDGDLCNGEEGKVNIFVYRTRDEVVSQEKITNLDEYIYSPYETVPPGDCIIVEFSQDKNSTDKLCNSYKLAFESGEVRYGG